MAMYFVFTLVWPEMSYLVRSGWVIVLSFTAVAVPTMRRNGWRIPFRDLIAAPIGAWHGSARGSSPHWS